MKRTITFFIIVYAMALAAPVGAQWSNDSPSAYQPWQPASPAGAQWDNNPPSAYQPWQPASPAQWGNSPPPAYQPWQPPSSTYERITRYSREFDDMQERSYRARWRENQWRRDLDASIEGNRRQAIVPGYIFEGENIRHPSILQTGCHQYNLECLNRLQSR